MDIVMRCLTECFTCLARKIVWIVVLAILFALLVLFVLMGGWDQAMFIDLVISAVAGAVIFSLICCLCGCLQKVEG